MVKRYLFFVLIAIAFVVPTYFLVFPHENFRLVETELAVNHRMPWSSQDRLEIQRILSQPFTHLGKGTQSHVFISQDQQYVLKFFKYRYLWNKRNEMLTGYELAFEKEPELSGLLYIQLWPQNPLFQQSVRVTDKSGTTREVNLSNIAFVIQKKAVIWHKIALQLVQKGDIATFKQLQKQILDLYLTEYSKGIYDRDHSIMHNIGFVDDKPVRLDVGRLTYDESVKYPKGYRTDLISVANKIHKWLLKYSGQHYIELRKEVEQQVSNILKETFSFD